MAPSRIAVQMKVLSSKRLYAITIPLPSQNRIFNRSPRFARKTKAVPVKGYSASVDWTRAASPF